METRPKSLALIQARDLAAHIDQPIFIVDQDGVLVFFNEAAEDLLGQQFESLGEMTRDKWVEMWTPQHPDGGDFPFDRLPVSVALSELRPSHSMVRITTAKGDRPVLEVTAVPLLPPGEPPAGAMTVFWRASQ